MPATRRRLLTTTCYLALFPILGCVRSSDTNSYNHETFNTLISWSEALESAIRSRFYVRGYNNCSDLAEALKKHGYGDVVGLDTDSWGRTMSLEHSENEGYLVTTITSLGQNGVREAGDGDDLSLQIKYKKGGTKLVVTFFLIDRNGQRLEKQRNDEGAAK